MYRTSSSDGQGGILGTTGSNNITSTATSTTEDGDLIFGAVFDTAGSNWTETDIAPGSSPNTFTERQETDGLEIEEFIQTSAASIAATWTFDIGARYNAIMVAFKAGTTSGTMTDTFDNALFALSQTGALTLMNSADSTSAFSVKNAAGVPQFVIDTTNSYVYIGDPTPDATGALLVMDNKNTSSDPTGVNGGMYYNSVLHSMRCYQDGSWVNCAINQIDHAYNFEDDFLSGTTVAAGATNITGVGDLGWNVTATTSCAVAYNQTGPALSHDHPGTVRLTTAAVSGNGCAMTQGGTAAGTPTLSEVIAAGDMVKTAVAVGAATGTVRVGLTNSTSNTAPTSGVWWEAVNGTDTNWRYCYANNAAATCADNSNGTPTITANTWVRLQIRIVSSTAVDFTYNGTTVSLTGITFDLGATNKLGPAFTCFASTTTAQNCHMDYYQWRGTVTTAGGR